MPISAIATVGRRLFAFEISNFEILGEVWNSHLVTVGYTRVRLRLAIRRPSCGTRRRVCGSCRLVAIGTFSFGVDSSFTPFLCFGRGQWCQGASLDERRSAGEEGLLVGDAGEAVVGGSGGASIVEPPDSDEDSEDSLASESRVDEAVLLDFSAPPSVLREQITAYHKYCRAKFAECGIKLQKRAGGWYAFQVRRWHLNKFSGPDNNREWQPNFLGVEVCEGTAWGVPIQWREINSSERNDPKVGPLAFGGIGMIVNVRGDEGREFMIGESEEDYVDYTVFNLINGRLEADSGAIVPEASPELIDEELDPELPMDKADKAAFKEAVKARMGEKKKSGQQSKSQGKKRSAEVPLLKDSRDNASKKLKTSSSSRAISAEVPAPIPLPKPIVASGGDKSNLDFLCNLMTRCLKVGDSKEIEAVEALEDDECAASIAVCAHKLSLLLHRMLASHRSSLARKDKELTELLDDSLMLLSRKECRGLHFKIDKEKKAREDAQRLHGLLEKKYTDLCAKFSKLEKENSTLTSDYASLKKARDDDAATHTMFRIQMENDLEDLRVCCCCCCCCCCVCIAEREKKEAARASAVADAADVAQDLADEARQELLKSIKEAHPKLDLNAFECAAEGEAEEEVEEESSPSLIAGETEPAATYRGGEVVDLSVTHVVIPSSEQLFTTDDLFDGLQADIAQSKEIADQIFAENGDESIANVRTVPTSSQAPRDFSADRQGDGEDAS
ncbi:hypothetical protein COLO4_16782 [Corchorus olitorius]|uniref:Uncharacterized protein n=1 Tax=Corchorus olitorius TaxID=93759 RepID=A0A1R3JFK8_9ROSI|nr:hypothetical protein COLO4_16782 [Corchorus olitorius]